MPARSDIAAGTKVAALLSDHPELEDLLISMSPAFIKLRNPVLRRSVARVATLRQAAAVGRLDVADLVNELRVAVGQEPLLNVAVDEVEYFGPTPEWFDDTAVVNVLLEHRPPKAHKHFRGVRFPGAWRVLPAVSGVVPVLEYFGDLAAVDSVPVSEMFDSSAGSLLLLMAPRLRFRRGRLLSRPR
jgi:hypothetical protein